MFISKINCIFTLLKLNSVMKKQNFENILSEITGKKIELLLLVNQDAKKWYDKSYTSEFSEINENTIYSVSWDNILQFDLKLGKKESFLKTFITQYVSKYLITSYEWVNEEYRKLTKEEAYKKLNNVNSIRLAYHLFYSTNYGIGMHNLYIGSEVKQKAKEFLNSFLTSKNIEYNNEYSDEMWVFRYKFKGSYLDHNELIKEIESCLK